MTEVQADAAVILDKARVGSLQLTVLATSALIGIAQGFDNQSLAFTAPAMAKAWHADPSAFASAFGAGLFGMMIGALMFGELADRFGRRVVFIAAAALLGAASLPVPLVSSVPGLSVLRFIGDLGLGGLPAVMASLVSEFSPKAQRGSFGMWALTGIPFGGFLGGLLATRLVPDSG